MKQGLNGIDSKSGRGFDSHQLHQTKGEIMFLLKSPKGYIKTLYFPISDSKLTQNRDEAYRFLDREWLEEKLRYYDSNYEIEEA